VHVPFGYPFGPSTPRSEFWQFVSVKRAICVTAVVRRRTVSVIRKEKRGRVSILAVDLLFGLGMLWLAREFRAHFKLQR
jgi:hypothetical protein